jgi:MOSC domain-containing protein YiiM
MNGVVIDILNAGQAGDVLVSHESAQLEAGKGLVGDRYYLSKGTFSEKLDGTPEVEVTLIEQEEIDEFNNNAGHSYTGKDFRRNIVTEGIRLNDLVGKSFNVGAAQLKGIRLCEPCAHLSGILGPEIMQHMLHKAGLRAQVIVSGQIKIADEVYG